MGKFLFKISFYIIGIVAVLLFLGSYADGNTDDNYMHFAVEKPQNIILGDSRGVQGVVPEVLKQKLSVPFDNFSLNIVQSPYGEIYLKALKRKLDPDTKNGIFILTVNPWNLALRNIVKKAEHFPEESSPFRNMYFYNMSPNYEYLLKNLNKSWFRIYLDREAVGRSNTFLHKDGWMEVNIDMNKDSIAARTAQKTQEYKDMLNGYTLSEKRMKALNEIIDYLQPKGTVYLVRIPTSKNITALENERFPEFNGLMRELSGKKQIKFYDFSNRPDDYVYTDGNHMYKESSKVLSSQIADSIIAADRKKSK
ncbi:hypothetical protein [Chryseobacterium vrystaatense]|uniref:Uncharacterized protein n=1 Tax=Chryseobacterium vrystaatense TaxID=307480 RepID=A0A1M4VRS6_9FLAO|nr:hypothetical protein [Chryseobacterium vrystaatense]SHE71774.1 hypothetical protein SAMN02787073_0967 [Chryseobacterium vrystaatense]